MISECCEPWQFRQMRAINRSPALSKSPLPVSDAIDTGFVGLVTDTQHEGNWHTLRVRFLGYSTDGVCHFPLHYLLQKLRQQ